MLLHLIQLCVKLAGLGLALDAQERSTLGLAQRWIALNVDTASDPASVFHVF